MTCFSAKTRFSAKIRFSARTRIGAILAFIVVLNGAAAFSQVVTGAILGRVTDGTGAVVPGATIQIQNVETAFARTEKTDSSGRYEARNLPLGSYSVTVQQAGFRTEVRSGISLSVGSEITVNLELAVGNVQEKVEVTGEAPVVETTTATLSNLVSQDQLRDLPLNGRSVDSLALLSPDVIANGYTTKNATVGLGIHLSVNGARPDSVLYLLDGTVVNDSTNNGHGSATGQTLGVEGILEFRMLTHDFSAEYGRNAGGVVSAVTRSGTNELHGSAYEFVRNNVFDARNFFNPGALPAFRRNQFGAAAGGRIVKDRIFFFANYEGLRQRQGVTVIASVPDLSARQGILPTSKVTVNPAAVPYINLYPLPNGKEHGDGTADYSSNFGTQATEDYAMERMDFRLSDKDNFYWRYVYDPSQSTAPELVPIAATTFRGSDHLAVLSETHIFSGASLNEFRFAFNRTYLQSNSLPIVPINPSLSFVPGQPLGTISFSSTTSGALQVSTLGTNQSAATWKLQNLFQETETFSTVRGAHSLKFGIDMQRQQIGNTYASYIRGGYQFGSLSALLTGTPTTFRFLQLNSTSNNQRGWRRTLFGGFIQDDYRVRSNVTLNLGLRYELFTNPSEANGLSGNLRNITDPTNVIGPPFETQRTNFAPRFGIAWDPTGSGKTSVRLGAGVFYNQLDGRTWFTNATNISTFLQSYQISTTVFPNAFTSGLTLGGLQVDQMIQFHPETPTVYHFNFEVQRQLAPSLSLRAGYVGSHGSHLAVEEEADIRIPQILADGSKFWPTGAPSLNPNFSSIPAIMTEGNFNYNGLQAVLDKGFPGGLRFQLSYSYSKAQSSADEITTGQVNSGVAAPLDIWNLARDYSLSAYDQRQRWVASGSYQMPWDKRLTGKLAKATLGGWAVNGIFSHGSGLPLDILDGFNNSRNGDTNQPDRPNLVSGFSNNPINGVTAGCTGVAAGQSLHTPNRWFDPCAFALSPAGTFGNLGRYTVTLPGLFNVDFTLVKMTPLTEKKNLEFRAEIFNLLNHANFGLPVNSVFNSTRALSGNAGQITGTLTDNRQIQLGLKLIF